MSSEAEEGLVYVYCIIPRGKYGEFGKIGIGGRADEIYTISHKELSAVVSRCKLPQYDRSDENILAHQRVVQKIFAECPAVPLPFSTVLKGEREASGMLESRYQEFMDKLERLGELVTEPPPSEPGKEIIEEALAHSFANALRVRQLSDEVVRLRIQPTGTAPSASEKALMEEIRALRSELQALGSVDRLVAQAVANLKAELEAKAKPAIPAKERGRLEEEILGPNRVQPSRRTLEDSVRDALKEFYVAEPWAFGKAGESRNLATAGARTLQTEPRSKGRRPTLTEATRSAMVGG